MKKKLCFIGLLVVMAFIVHDVVAVQYDLNAVKEKTGLNDIQPRMSCKWKQVSCDNGNQVREVCIVDGNGTSCRCGTVSRECHTGGSEGGSPGGDGGDGSN